MTKPNPLRNERAERACIGSMLVDGACLDDMPPELRPECFADDVLAKLFAAMQSLRAEGKPIDAFSVPQRFDETNPPVTSGTPSLVMELMDAVPHHKNASYYAAMVIDAWRRRLASNAVSAMRGAMADASTNFDDAMGVCETELRKVAEACTPRANIGISDILVDCLDEKNRCRKGTETGFPSLDNKTGGIHEGQLIIIAARTTIGKSALAANIATNLVERGDGAMMFTLEMSKADFCYRLIARMSGLRMWQIRGGDPQYNGRILDAANLMNQWPLVIDDTVPITTAQIGAKVRSWMRRQEIKLVVIDYLQLVAPSDRKAPREQQIAAISRELKLLAKQLRIPIIALSQLNRQVESRTNKMPMLSDIRESGAVEQDADAIWLIHRPGQSDGTMPQDAATLIIAKNRQGETGHVDLEWIGERFLFREKPTAADRF